MESHCGCKYIVESLPEIPALKIDIPGQLDEIAEPDAIIGTNSSSYESSELIGKVKRPERVLNTHYGQRPNRRRRDAGGTGRP